MSQVTNAATDPFGLLREFLRGGKYGTPLELMDAALRDEEPGAALLVVLRTYEGQPVNQTQYGNVDQSSWANTVAKVVWSVCTPGVHNDANVLVDGSARGKGCWLNDKCIQGDAGIVTCRSCRGPVTAFGATSTCQNKRHLEINGREAGGGAV